MYDLHAMSMSLLLPMPMTGARIRRIVKQIAEKNNDDSPYEIYPVEGNNADHPELIMLGQVSEYAHDHIMVTGPNSPFDGLADIDLYNQVLVKHCSWPGAVRLPFDHVETARRLVSFTEELSQRAQAELASATS